MLQGKGLAAGKGEGRDDTATRYPDLRREGIRNIFLASGPKWPPRKSSIPSNSSWELTLVVALICLRNTSSPAASLMLLLLSSRSSMLSLAIESAKEPRGLRRSSASPAADCFFASLQWSLRYKYVKYSMSPFGSRAAPVSPLFRVDTLEQFEL